MDPIKYLTIRFNINPDRSQPVELPIGRDKLGCIFADLGLNKGVEMGVEQGKYSESLCQQNPQIELYCVDAWTAYQGYRDHVSQIKLDGFYEITKERLSPYNATLIRKFSMDAVKDFDDNSLDFVYIDGNHEFQQVTNDIAEWSKKVRSGGIVAGHDYTRRKGVEIHVKDVVQGWTYAKAIQPWFVTTLDKSNSWFWVKK